MDEIKPIEGNVAKGEDAQSVLLNTTSRNHLINELLEVINLYFIRKKLIV